MLIGFNCLSETSCFAQQDFGGIEIFKEKQGTHRNQTPHCKWELAKIKTPTWRQTDKKAVCTPLFGKQSVLVGCIFANETRI